MLMDVSSKGYATLDYEDAGWRESQLSKIQLLVNKQPVDAICRIVHKSQVDRLGRQWVTKFKEHVTRQMFGEFILLRVGDDDEVPRHLFMHPFM
jgi:translation elongation factor EF-4